MIDDKKEFGFVIKFHLLIIEWFAKGVIYEKCISYALELVLSLD